MKVELIKKTVKIRGDVYYYINVDEAMQSETWTSDLEKAELYFMEVCAKCIAYPVDKYETIKSETI